MPKKKGLAGIEEAFDVDVAHVRRDDPREALPQEENFKRVTISLSPSLLKKLDGAVKNLRARGASVNRSSYIAEAVLARIEGETEQ